MFNSRQSVIRGGVRQAWVDELVNLPVAVALCEDGTRIQWANRAWVDRLGTGRRPPAAFDRPEPCLFDHAVDGERWALRAASAPLLGDGRGNGRCRRRALVAEDVTEAIFAGSDPSQPPGTAALRLVRFVPVDTVAREISVAEQVIEPMWSPMLLLRGDPVRVAYANGAARSQYGFELGEIIEYAMPLGLGGSLTTHFESMITRRGVDAPLPVRLWPTQPGDVATLAMLEPSPVRSDLFEPVLDGALGSARRLV